MNFSFNSDFSFFSDNKNCKFQRVWTELRGEICSHAVLLKIFSD